MNQVLTANQLSELQREADYLKLNGYTSTPFARALSVKAHLLGIDIQSSDDFYNLTPEGNAPMLELLNELGYCKTPFGIIRNKPFTN